MQEAEPQIHHRILPLKVYLRVGAALLILTGVTVTVAQTDFGGWNLVIAMVIAAFKAILVAMFFMHLKYDSKVYSVIFSGAVLFLMIFIVFTMFDTLNRGAIEPIVAKPISQYARIYDEFGNPLGRAAGAEAAQAGALTGFEMTHGIGPIKEEVKLGPLDTSLANTGERIFEVKCATCHKLDERFTGPSLRGVTRRRSPAFIMNQILNPDENVKRHPEGKKLLAEHLTLMTFQNVTEQDARALLEYLRMASEEE